MDCRGFTLIELMIVIALAAILLVIGLPSLQNAIAANQVTTQTNTFIAAVYLARSEAIKRNTSVVLMAIDASNSGNEWGNGWRVEQVSDSYVIREYPPMASSMTFNSTNSNDRFVFNARGFMVAGTDTLDVCHSADIPGKRIGIYATGRTLIQGNTGC